MGGIWMGYMKKFDILRYIYIWKADNMYFLRKKKKKITNWHPLTGPKIRPKMLKNESFTRINPVTLVFNRFSKCWYQNLRKITYFPKKKKTFFFYIRGTENDRNLLKKEKKIII